MTCYLRYYSVCAHEKCFLDVSAHRDEIEAISWPWDVITFLLLSQYHHVVTGSNTRLQNELFDSNIH